MKSIGYKSRRYILALMAAAGLYAVAEAGPASVSARLDSVSILMGKVSHMQLQVVQQKGDSGYFPLLERGGNGKYVGICGDSVELSRQITRDTVELDSGKIQINCTLGVQSFDSGYYKLPEIAYVTGRDTVWTDNLYLKVEPVKAEADDPISDFAATADANGKKWSDSLPDWLYYYWWVVVLTALAIGIGVWVISRRKKGISVLPAKPTVVVPPHEAALKALSRLKEKKLWERGMEKEYFTELTEILRVYLERRFGINAMEMTSRQIMQTLGTLPDTSDKRKMISQILDMADFVKFAKVRPLPTDNVAAFDNAVKFVETTSPKPSEEVKKAT